MFSLSTKIKDFIARKPTVSVISLRGIVAASPSNSICISNVNAALEKAFETRNIKAVAIEINSPGGSPAQASLIFKRIRGLSKEKKIPVITFVEDIAASAGYYIACAGDEIYVDECSLVGSIGVLSANLGFNKVLDHYQIERRMFTRGKYKGSMDPLSEMKPQDMEPLNELLDSLYLNFIKVVKERRGDKLKKTSILDDELFSGRVWSGEKSLELGLVDGIGTKKEILTQKFGKDIKIQNIRVGSFFQGFLQSYSIQSIVESIIKAVENRALWSMYGK